MKRMIEIDADLLEHILNCMCNQKFIHEQKPEMQKEWQSAIDKAYDDGMMVLLSANGRELR